MIATKKRFDIRASEPKEEPKDKRFWVILIIGFWLVEHLLFWGFTLNHYQGPKGKVPVWVEPKHQRVIEIYQGILESKDGLRTSNSGL